MASRFSTADKCCDDLRKMESDLILAAEVGKALLERNEALKAQNEQMKVDFEEKLEVRNAKAIKNKFMIDVNY